MKERVWNKEGEWEERDGKAEGRERKGERGSGRKKRVGKGKGGLDLDLCPGAPQFLVTPLYGTDRQTEGQTG